MKLVDVYGDGDSKLIVADADKRLKMYKGGFRKPIVFPFRGDICASECS